jgi:hypothetical protein
MAKKSFVPGFPLALRQVADETEQVIKNTPFASKMTRYCEALQACLEESGFEPLGKDRRGRVDIVVRRRGYVIAIKIGHTRLSSRTLEALADYKADYRMVVLRDWNISDKPRRFASGVDQIITPFQLMYNAKDKSVKRINGSAKNTNNIAISGKYNVHGKKRFDKLEKSAENTEDLASDEPSRVRARKSLRVSNTVGVGQWVSRKSSLLASLEEETLPTRRGGIEARFANQNSLSGLGVAESSEIYKIDLNRMRAVYQQVRGSRRVANAKSRTRLRRRHCRIDWSDLDQTGRPVLSFESDDPKRPALLKVLERDARDRTRQACVRKLGVEFSRIYERYRAACNRRDGRLGSVFRSALASEKHRQYCEEIAILCVELAVTPRALLEYWDKNIKDFTDGQVTIPPLAFLKSASAVDRVACSALGSLGKSDEGRERAKKNTSDRNPYADLSRFDSRLRHMLESVGFDTTRYNDRYLLSVQHNALAVARGADLLLVPGQFGDMIKIAADWYKGQLEVANA